ncbi:MAG: hypothetical protein MH132_12525 [Hydrotalea sp.]|nr:hypothetical protein [Hydrotalea sp.]MCG9900822.1 hypothetical protein [Hydrotalea sp.]
MTPKQIESAKKKIADIKRTLAAEKRKLGCYDDSRGLRYLPTKYYIQLNDFIGGLSYLKWFDKNFPDDEGFPEFLFEQTIILFKCDKTKQAQQKAFQTFCSNPYWFDKFFGRSFSHFDLWHSSNLTKPEYTKSLIYSSTDPKLTDFSVWLDNLISTDDFVTIKNSYIDILKRLKTESDLEMRYYLVLQASHLKNKLF